MGEMDDMDKVYLKKQLTGGGDIYVIVQVILLTSKIVVLNTK